MKKNLLNGLALMVIAILLFAVWQAFRGLLWLLNAPSDILFFGGAVGCFVLIVACYYGISRFIRWMLIGEKEEE